MENLTSLQIYVIIGSAIAGIILTRLVFSIPRIVRELKAQTLLTAKIAEMHGVQKEDIDKIVKEAKTSFLTETK